MKHPSSLIQRPLLITAVDIEQRPLDITSTDIVLAGEISNDLQEPVPLFEIKTDAIWVRGHGAHIVQKLPNTNVDDAVASRICEHENRGRHRNAHTVQPREKIQFLPLTAGTERRFGHTPDRRFTVAPNMFDGAGRFPPAHRDKLRLRKIAQFPCGQKFVYHRLSCSVFCSRKMQSDKMLQSLVR